tara:strand:- start:8102 stop:9043 length:942 start_codon:yes stop_codon:yes gene_type:complete
MEILITGAAGLIGSHLCDSLTRKGYIVSGVDNLSFGNINNIPNNVDFIKDDITSWQYHLHWNNFEYKKYDVIFHLASLKKVWDGSIASAEVMDVNYNMTKVLVNKCLTDGSKLIFASTSDIYGNSTFFKEDDNITMGAPTNLRYSYALSKWHSEQYILNSIQESNLQACIARIFGCASNRSNKSWSGGHVPLFIDLAMNNKEIIIHGDGSQTRSISHASDIADGLSDLIPINNEIVNLGTDQETTVKYIAEYVKEKVGSLSKISYVNKDKIFGNYNEIQRRFANTSKAKQLIDYKVNYTTEQVVDSIIEAWQK